MRFLRILSCSSLSEQPCTMSHFSLSKLRKFWTSFSGRYNWQAEWKTWITQSCLVTLGEIVDFSVNIGGGWQLFVSFLTVIFCETCIKWGVQVACSMCLELQRSLLYFSHFWCIQKCSFSSVFCPFPSLPVSNLMGRRSYWNLRFYSAKPVSAWATTCSQWTPHSAWRFNLQNSRKRNVPIYPDIHPSTSRNTAS